jgi:hypothetical protein
MTEHIRECFPAYAINFVAHNRPERARRALDDYTIFDVPGSSEVARDLRQRAFQILFLGALRTKMADCVAALIDQLSQEIRNPLYQRFRGRICCDLTVCDFQLERRAQNSLQKGVMQFSRDSFPLV